MILVLLQNPETAKSLPPLPTGTQVRSRSQAESLTEFQRRRVHTVLYEWDENTPPAASVSQLFSHARLATFAARFRRSDVVDSRKRGFAEHFFLPLPENFFEELQREGAAPVPPSLIAQESSLLQLLEKHHDYESVCHYVAEALQDQLSSVPWCVNVKDQNQWKTLFASPTWNIDPARLHARLQGFAGGNPSAREQHAAVSDELLCIPLIKDGTFAGVVCCQGEDGPHASAAAVINDVAVFLGSAFHHVDMLIEKERLTFTDTLTSLYNYRYLRQFLLNDIRRCSRYNKTVSILFIDIDWFKSVNDNHGHLAGSDTLVEIGNQFSSMVRESDVVVRYGGDEFVIILPETSPGGAETIAERVRKSVESHTFGIEQGRNVRITISIGIAGYPDHGFSVDELIRKADGAMYDAKNSMKNTVRVAS
ncbi:MAG TPA: GGDEF domain-containing protein [Acidobacteriota bacterium]|jgi:diguanylate cyclase (GGDEF)-like protein|nr:GGDEF domain-containing protein [Acidobacteriota bacterium]